MGKACLVQDPEEKLRALAALLDHVAPGRSTDSRLPSARELAKTAVLALDLVEVSAKVRAGGRRGRHGVAVLGRGCAAHPAGGNADPRRRPRSGGRAATLPCVVPA